jgi:hypothetical protein
MCYNGYEMEAGECMSTMSNGASQLTLAVAALFVSMLVLVLSL